MPDRKPIPKRLRFEIFHRDGFICQYCGRRPPDVVLELDHIHPHSQGGTDEELNLVTSCEDCNRGKSDRILAERAVRPDADLRYLEAQQEIAEAKRFLQAKQERDALTEDLLHALHQKWATLFPYNEYPGDLTFRQMLETYSVTEIHEAMKVAANKHRRQRFPHRGEICNYIWGVLWHRANDPR